MTWRPGSGRWAGWSGVLIAVAVSMAGLLLAPGAATARVTGPSIRLKIAPSGTVHKAPTTFALRVEQIGASYANAYAGQTTTDSGVVVYVVRGEAAPFLAALRSAALDLKGEYSLRYVANSWVKLDGLTRRMAGEQEQEALAADGVQLASWGPDVASNRVVITLRHYSSRAAGLLVSRYGSGLVAINAKSQSELFHAYTRYTDTSPFYGGDYIWNTTDGENEPCTSGLTFIGNNSGKSFILTAGHCDGGTSWYTNRSDPQYMGYTSTDYLQSGYDQDLLSIRGNAAGYVWGDGTDVFTVVSAFDPGIGQLVTVDGSITGEVRTAAVTDTYLCEEIEDAYGEYTACDTAIAEKSGATLCQEGDSGAPVYQHVGSTVTVKAVGILIAGYGDASASSECLYQMIGPALSLVNGSIASGLPIR